MNVLMFKLLDKKVLFSQLGVINLFLIIILLIGIITGVSLIQKKQILKSKATSNSIEWIISDGNDPDNCVITKDSQIITTCPKVKFRLTPPLDNQTSNSSFKFIKITYAKYLPPPNYCDTIKSGIGIRYAENPTDLSEKCFEVYSPDSSGEMNIKYEFSIQAIGAHFIYAELSDKDGNISQFNPYPLQINLEKSTSITECSDSQKQIIMDWAIRNGLNKWTDPIQATYGNAMPDAIYYGQKNLCEYAREKHPDVPWEFTEKTSE